MHRLTVGIVKSALAVALALLLASRAEAQFLEPSLKTVSRPEPTNLNDFIADREAAIRLGKALFWDIRLGSDNQTACATCHHHAGADSRVTNLAHPGANGNFTQGCEPGKPIPAAMFPTVRFANPADRFSQRTLDIDDVVASPGVMNHGFFALDPNGNEIVTLLDERVFVDRNGIAHRQVTGRNTPPTINAVFNIRQFWDGRANAWFNGANPFGPVDDGARVWKVNPQSGAPEQVQVQIDHASLASQAVGPVNNEVEMAAAGRTWVHAARKLIDRPALMNQKVDPTDSVLGEIAAPGTGLTLTYNQMISAAFKPEWWNGGTVSPGVTQMQANMALFFGLAVQMYESTLVSDDSRYDQWIELNGPMGDAPHLMTQQELRGLRLFFNLDPGLPATNCRECHITSNFTVATYNGKVGGNVLAGIGAFPAGTPDTDGDKVPDIIDAFPLDPTEWIDTDGDGIGNNADPDDDNDGIPDIIDPAPLEPGVGPPPPADPRLAPMPLAYMPDMAASLLATQVYQEPPLGTEPHIQRLGFRIDGGIDVRDINNNVLAHIPLAPRNTYPCTYNNLVITPIPAFGPEAFIETVVSVINCQMTIEVVIIGFPNGTYPLYFDGNRRGTLVAAPGVVYDEGFYNIAVRPPGEDPGVNGLHPNGTPLSAARRALANPTLTEFGVMPSVAGLNIQVDNAFKTPSLRNTELTGPYMHNGGIATLEDVIRFYNRGGDFHDENLFSIAPAMTAMNLDETHIADLAAFLRTLTDERVRLERAPFDHPELPIPGAPTLPAVGIDGRDANMHPLRTFAENVQDLDGDGILGQFDNCPSVANADQLNSDGDGFGNACDADDDNDGTLDINDAYAVNASKSDIDSQMLPAAISAFLANSNAAAANGSGMSAAQLAAVADGATGLRAGGLYGTFTLTSGVSAAQIQAIFNAALAPTATTGGAVITANAAGMDLVQLGALAANLGRLQSIHGLTVTSEHSAALIAALVTKTVPGGATVVATDMTEAQLAAAVSGANSVVITGTIRVHSGYSAALLAEIASQLAAGSFLSADTTGMSAAQQAALASGGSLVIDCNQATGTGDVFTVSINLGNLPARAVGVQARLVFDPALIEYVPSEAGVGGTDFPMTILELSQPGMVTFSTGVDIGGSGEGVFSGNAAQLRFRAIGSICSTPNFISLAGSGFTHRISSQSLPGAPSSPIPFSVVNLANVSALGVVTMTGAPTANVSTPVDAGTVLGAAIAQPTVTATDGCGPVPVVMTVQLPAASGGATTSLWPSHFPVGVSTVTWTATTAGQTVTRSQTIEVLDYQVVTVDVNLIGGMPAAIAYSMPIRFRLDSGHVITQPVNFAGADGAVTDLRVPVRPNYGCISAKSTTHTVSASASLGIVGTKYVAAAPVALPSGDSNDDNLVDVLDFGNFASDRGLGKNATSRSNYDHNPVVNTADFTFITLNFFKLGGECSSNFAPGQPRDRVKVKDLRRAGLGHMAVADINGDGWVDTTDMALFAQGAVRNDHAELDAPAGGMEGGSW